MIVTVPMSRKLHIVDPRAKPEIVDILRKGGVVVLPTDTLYGFSTPMSSEIGIKRIASIKGNGEERQFIFLASGITMVENYIDSWGCAEKGLLEDIWPAPLTAVFPSGKSCPVWVGGTIALRVPALDPLLEIIHELGEPIVSTSINRSGERPLTRIKEIERIYGERVDLIVSGEGTLENFSSTIVDFSEDIPVLVRQGSYHWEWEEDEESSNG